MRSKLLTMPKQLRSGLQFTQQSYGITIHVPRGHVKPFRRWLEAERTLTTQRLYEEVFRK